MVTEKKRNIERKVFRERIWRELARQKEIEKETDRESRTERVQQQMTNQEDKP